MRFRTFQFFYILAILLLAFGLLTKDVEIIVASWHTTIIKGMWSFFIPTATGSLLTGFIYHYWFKTGRPVSSKTIILHFCIMTLGLLFSLDIYRLTTLLLNSGVPDTATISGNSLFFILIGPILLITSLIIFIFGLVKAKRITK